MGEGYELNERCDLDGGMGNLIWFYDSLLLAFKCLIRLTYKVNSVFNSTTG